MTRQADLDRFITTIRALHQEADAAVRTMLSGAGITMRMGAVLSVLHRHGPATVPAIARRLEIRRQYVQVMINDLVRSGLVARQQNPGHRRSHLYQTSGFGAEVATQIETAEATLMARFSRDLTSGDIAAALHVAAHVTQEFQRLNKELQK